tara:strand:- start:17 stop:463 length:447 start_codon:yes stop_codon:yes gene_type:complete
MSDSKMQSYATYDYSKNIDCSEMKLSTVYINALQKVCSDMIIQDEEKASSVGATFQKFEDIVKIANDPDSTDEDKAALPKLDAWESNLYTVFSLLQQLKYLAKDQGLEILHETSATKEEVEAMADLVKSGKNITDKMHDLESKLRIVK